MRILDGPDDVHLRTVARAELARSRAAVGSTHAYLQRRMPPHPMP
jgi:acyl-CoA dehydrogenase